MEKYHHLKKTFLRKKKRKIEDIETNLRTLRKLHCMARTIIASHMENANRSSLSAK